MTQAQKAVEAYARELEAEVEKLLSDDAYMNEVAEKASKKVKAQEARNVYPPTGCSRIITQWR